MAPMVLMVRKVRKARSAQRALKVRRVRLAQQELMEPMGRESLALTTETPPPG